MLQGMRVVCPSGELGQAAKRWQVGGCDRAVKRPAGHLQVQIAVYSRERWSTFTASKSIQIMHPWLINGLPLQVSRSIGQLYPGSASAGT